MFPEVPITICYGKKRPYRRFSTPNHDSQGETVVPSPQEGSCHETVSPVIEGCDLLRELLVPSVAHPSPSGKVARHEKGVAIGCRVNKGSILGVDGQLTFSLLPGVGPANKHKPWIEAEYQGIVMENDNTVLLNPPLFALDKDAPLRYAGNWQD